VPLETPTIRRTEVPGFEGLQIIDCDVHNFAFGNLQPYLSERWRDYLALTGKRNLGSGGGVASPQRPNACRLDAVPPNGPPGSDPDFAREQLLDEYGISAAILNTIETMAAGNAPAALEVDIARAMNDYNLDTWLESDPRWLASICIAPDHPEEAAKEIARCREQSDRYVQVIVSSRTERPQGNPKYWPIYEAASHYDLPVAYHVGTSKYHSWTGVGGPTFYYEVHVSFPFPAQSMVPSFIFEGVFDRWPNLKIVPTEVGWEWVVPLAWRLDSSWRAMRDEVAHLERKPSDYLRDHFWFSTQPCVESEDPQDVYELFAQFERAGFGDKLMFATDYPHWDMDSPFDATPRYLSREQKSRILAGNAAALYGIPLTGESTEA
jgi:uncharacterized protein